MIVFMESKMHLPHISLFLEVVTEFLKLPLYGTVGRNCRYALPVTVSGEQFQHKERHRLGRVVTLSRAEGSLVTKTSNSSLECLDLMPDATKYPPSTRRVRARKSKANKSLVGGRSENHGCRGLENMSLPSSLMPKLWWWR
ncbi:hypothetical protein TNCV_3591641 [Trichonephila clavipes]|nr:hypothetical protein TNCV_3591641 [Trichonephila clavipes]